MFLDFVDRRRRHHRGRLPDGKLIAAGSLDRTVSVGLNYRVLGRTLRLRQRKRQWPRRFSLLCRLLQQRRTNRFRVLRQNRQVVALGRQVRQKVDLRGNLHWPQGLCFVGLLYPDNEYILSGSKDRGVIFWDQASGNPLLMLQGHRNSVISVAVSLNSKGTEGIFATGSGDCKAKWTKNKCVVYICEKKPPKNFCNNPPSMYSASVTAPVNIAVSKTRPTIN